MADRLQVIGIGLATLDVLLRHTDMPTWTQGATIVAFRLDGGGLVGTAMVAAAKLGARVGYIGTAGTDEAAELKLRSMASCGVDLTHLVRRPGPEDQLVIVHVHAETGERVFTRIEPWLAHPVQPDELDKAYIVSADYLHIDGSHFEAARQAAEWMRAEGKQVVMDGSKTNGPVSERQRALIPLVDVLITGSGFARGLTGCDDIWHAGETILGMGPRVFVETVGERGSYTITAKERFHTPAFPVGVVDTTGAGDVYHGAYIVGLLHGWSPRQCALFSTAAAAIKCGQLGGRSGIPSYDQVMAFLRNQGHGHVWAQPLPARCPA